MTTDDEEGRKQVEEMTTPPRFKVGDKVRLKAAGREMEVIAVEDYGNQIVCRWSADDCSYGEALDKQTHSRASLVHCDAHTQSGEKET